VGHVVFALGDCVLFFPRSFLSEEVFCCCADDRYRLSFHPSPILLPSDGCLFQHHSIFRERQLALCPPDLSFSFSLELLELDPTPTPPLFFLLAPAPPTFSPQTETRPPAQHGNPVFRHDRLFIGRGLSKEPCYEMTKFGLRRIFIGWPAAFPLSATSPPRGDPFGSDSSVFSGVRSPPPPTF